jgi:hypothetical protein
VSTKHVIRNAARLCYSINQVLFVSNELPREYFDGASYFLHYYQDFGVWRFNGEV